MVLLSELSEDDRMALGKRIHEGPWKTVAAAKAVLNVDDYTYFSCQRLYRESIGYVTRQSQTAISRVNLASMTPAEKLEHKRAIGRAYRAGVREKERAAKAVARASKANGGYTNGSQQVATLPDHGPVIAQLQSQVDELTDQLDHALAECHTLQKILMTVGKTL